MWQNPHIVAIDEPTDYFDRDAVGALAEVTKNWLDGAVVISHGLAFCELQLRPATQ